jgi:hypothetical protein
MENNILVLKNAIIGFRHQPGSHTGRSLAKAAIHILDRAGISHDQVRL